MNIRPVARPCPACSTGPVVIHDVRHCQRARAALQRLIIFIVNSFCWILRNPCRALKRKLSRKFWSYPTTNAWHITKRTFGTIWIKIYMQSESGLRDISKTESQLFAILHFCACSWPVRIEIKTVFVRLKTISVSLVHRRCDSHESFIMSKMQFQFSVFVHRLWPYRMSAWRSPSWSLSAWRSPSWLITWQQGPRAGV